MISSYAAHIDVSLHALPHPVHQLRLSKLRQVVDALLAEGVNAAEVHVLRWRLADPLDDDGRVRLKDNAVVDDLVHGERNQIVVLQEGSLIDLGAEEEVERVSQSEDDAVQKYLRHMLDRDARGPFADPSGNKPRSPGPQRISSHRIPAVGPWC